MSLRDWWADRQHQRIARHVRLHDPFVDQDSMRKAFKPLSETTITWDDLSICWGCGHLFLTSMEAKHIYEHDWQHQTNPIRMLRPMTAETLAHARHRAARES